MTSNTKSVDGTIYADTDDGNGRANGAAIIAINPNHTLGALGAVSNTERKQLAPCR
jgi:hypothetical protein